ncbi:endonuclease/exonuclease/phosphatase family protein [Motiliproteus sp. SC1-56]|uniref:endonuclease/exonuclease/phosphatase family protein n=1 Tax=Motiliproteus sp. SC1-56 TaxID=2799565 RepID=UPI001A8C0C65|nr:endonuclease/exonuclease/phosphatase family protein [Motiliproteus sp. SC1-56]
MLTRRRHPPARLIRPRRSPLPSPEPNNRLRLLSFNIQGGINSSGFHHYLTRSWQHLLPHPRKQDSLSRIARVVRDFDMVALQEVDGGSFRSSYVNQVRYLAEAAQFPYWYQQLNRNLGRVAQHSNGLLSRFHPEIIEDHRLPGLLPGRGAIIVRFGAKKPQLTLAMLHLSLGSRSRLRQLQYVREVIGDEGEVVVMGDLNVHHERITRLSALEDIDLRSPEGHFPTFPSWQPAQSLDHILVSSGIKVHQARVLDFAISDHLPIAVEVELPAPLINPS